MEDLLLSNKNTSSNTATAETINQSSSFDSFEMDLEDNYEDYYEQDVQENGFIWVHRPHPMCIPHIVDNILSYLSVSDLKSSRRVNSQYNEIGCRNLARKEVVMFNKISHLSSYLLLMPISCRTVSYLSTVSSTPGSNIIVVPGAQDNNPHDEEVSSSLADKINSNAHVSYHFNFDPDCSPNDTDPEAYNTLLSFFDTLGPYIKKLHYTTDLIPFNFPKKLPHLGDIWKNRMYSLETLSLEMKWGIPSVLFEKENDVILPFVKTLVLDVLVTEREADRAASFLKQLLAATPNVEEITIPGNKKFFDDYINVVLARIILSLDFPRLAKLNFCLALDEIQIRSLAEKNFPLKSLILDFAEMQHNSFPIPNNNNDENNNNNNNVLNHPLFQNQVILDRSLQALFTQAAPTLKNLHLSFPFNRAHPLHRFTFPEPMIKLGHFALGGFYGSVTILDKLPALRKLDLWNVRFYDFDYDATTTTTISTDAEAESEEINKKEETRPRFVPKQYVDITTVIS